jgi:hypothetical protein
VAALHAFARSAEKLDLPDCYRALAAKICGRSSRAVLAMAGYPLRLKTVMHP